MNKDEKKGFKSYQGLGRDEKNISFLIEWNNSVIILGEHFNLDEGNKADKIEVFFYSK